ncbi:hypothetical protein MAR_006785 [Mya arenaria]|uniref:C2H2-type domain-containing protein n=1 Tax=Mya arenaria TaxID=6604 RepID=A0ABY7DAH1_MYAAR|nr:hypothetical protein MAR_006785 [Mya arenaria]
MEDVGVVGVVGVDGVERVGFEHSDVRGWASSEADMCESSISFDDERLIECRKGEKQWLCPVGGCTKVLSRKQTLKIHIAVFHQLEKYCVQTRTYKDYEYTAVDTFPRTTAWRKHQHTATSQHTHHEEITHMQSNECHVPLTHDAGANVEPEPMDIDYEINENAILDNDVKDTESAPLYIVKCNMCPNSIYNSQITKKEHELAILTFSARHNLSDAALEDLLKLVNLYLPESNLVETNIEVLKERCGFNGTFLKSHTFCNICKNILKSGKDTCSTPNCPGKTPSLKTKSFFMTADLKVQLQEILTRPGVWESIKDERSKPTHSSFSDITDGDAYTALKLEGCFLSNSDNITFTMFTDGVPLFKSSGVSMWPVYLLINEIPRSQRFHKKNMLLWGVWQGAGKPQMTIFLKELIKDLSVLQTEGFTFTVDSCEIKCKAMLIVATMDLQARSAVLKMVPHNGEQPCVYCLEKGVTTSSGKGHCKSFPYTENPRLRSKDQIKADTGNAQIMNNERSKELQTKKKQNKNEYQWIPRRKCSNVS